MSVVKKRLLVVSVLTIVGLLLAGCAPAAAPTPTPTKPPPTVAPGAATPAAPTPTKAPTTPGAETPRYGGILVGGLDQYPKTFDMHQETTLPYLRGVAPCYNGILQYDPANTVDIIPELAEKWEVSPDGKTYTFYLRKGVKFHDGTPFTSADAQYSILRVAQPPKGFQSFRESMLIDIDKVETPDQDTLKVILKAPSASFMWQFASGHNINIFPKRVLEAKGHMKNDVDGTGPFKMKGYVTDVSLEMVKNPDYFVKGRPYLDGIVYYVIPDTATRLAAFRAGKLNLLDEISPSQAELVRKDMPESVVIEKLALRSWVFAPVQNKPYWKDVRVRRAAFLAIDRQVGIKVAAEGAAEIGGYFLPGVWGFSKEELEKMPGFRQPKDADRAEAKRLLAEAGYPNGFETALAVRAGRPDHEKFSVYIRDQLATIGIKANLDVQEYARWQDLRRKDAHDCFQHPMALTISDPGDITRYFMTDGTYNDYAFSDPKVDELIEKQARILDINERKKAIRGLEELLFQLAPTVPTFWPTHFHLMTKEVKNYFGGVGLYNNLRHEGTWLAK